MCIAFGFVGCSDNNDTLKTDKLNETKLRFFIKVPNENVVATRGYKEADTYKIDTDNLQIILFENNKYYKNCNIEEVKVTPTGDIKEYEIKIDIPHNDKLVDIVVIANHDINGVKLTPEETKKEDFYNNLSFKTTGAWNNKLLPMWGEIKSIKLTEDVGTKFAKEALSVTMMRSVARIDLSYEQNANFIVKSAFLFNTLDRGTIAPADENLEGIQPNIKVIKPTLVQGALYNVNSGSAIASPTTAQSSPIEIKFVENSGSPILTFIPEQTNVMGSPIRPTLVLAIHNKNEKDDDAVTYYKINFEVKNEENKRVAIDILRNYKYIVTVKSVTGKGYETPQDALKGEATNIDVDVVRWQENINQGYIFGSKYFGIETTNIEFEEATIGQEKFFQYQSNIENITEELSFDFSEKGLFEASVANIEGKQLIKITTLTENKENFKLEADLVINAIGHQFTINIQQNTQRANYSLNCDATKVFGIYKVGETQDYQAGNYINVEVNVANENYNLVNNKRYEFKSEEVDGIYFYAEGNLNQLKKIDNIYKQTIRLQAHGTTKSQYNKNFTIMSNSIEASYCDAIVKMALTTKRIVAAGSSRSYGWGAAGGVSAEAICYALNLGLHPNSKVKIPQFYNEDSSEYSRLSANQKREVSVYKQYNASRPGMTEQEMARELPNTDIFIYGAFVEMHHGNKAKLLADFLVNKNGVVIAMDEVPNSADALIKAIYVELEKKEGKNFNLTLGARTAGNAGTIYPIITQPGDPIFDGPFNINGQRVQYWGEDATVSTTVLGIPENDIVVYSRSVTAGEEESGREDRGLTMFRHTKVNLFFSGDGGFTSQNSGRNEANTHCPFWTVNYRGGDLTPTYRPVYHNGYEGQFGVGNGIIFFNALAWALEKAELEGMNSNK